MQFRFTLTDPANVKKVISEPAGWDVASIGVSRHDQLLSLVEYFKSSFHTYGSNGDDDGGRDWILDVERTYGPDALIAVLVEIDLNDDGQYQTVYSGNLGVSMFVETLGQDHFLQIVFANSDFWSKIMSRWKSQVDVRSTLDLDGNAVTPAPKFILPLPSQKIIKKYSAYLQYNQVFQIIDITNVAFLVGFDIESLKEIQDQSSIKLYLINGSDGAMANAMDPKSYNQIVPYFNPLDDGVFSIDKLKFTMSQGPSSDANYAATADYTCATNDKNTKLTNVDFYLQKNTETPILLTKSYRSISGTFVRNDGVLETLYSGTYDPFVTDFELPANTVLNIKKFDAIKLFGIYNDEPSFPFKIRNGLVWMWGTDGWSADSGYDQMRAGQGSYIKWRGASSIHDDSNRGDFCYGGLYDPTAHSNTFPSTIDNDAGTGLPIKASQWWVIGKDGYVAGGTIPIQKGKIIQARVNSPTDTLGDWWIWNKTPYEGLEDYGSGNGFNVSFNTTLADSSCEAFLTHDIASAIIDRISGKTGLFYSEYLGNPWTSRVYPDVGCGSLKANMLGLHVRGYRIDGDSDPNKNKPYAPSMEDYFNGLNPIDCVGIGYEKVGGVDRVVLEKASHFFDSSSMSILLSNVQTIKRSYDPDWQFNSVDYGYEKWQSQSGNGIGTPSGIDDPQSKGTRNSILKIIGKKIKILSKWLGASLAIETMRRLGSLQSANYTYDNDTVVICLKSNGDGTFTPELNENYSSITNLLNAETRYNTSISSSRNFERWLPLLSGCLQAYPTSSFIFATGEGNFIMHSTKNVVCGDETTDPVIENGDIQVSPNYLFVPIPLEIDHYMEFSDYQTFIANKNKAIGISQTESDHVPLFIKDLDYVIVTGLVKIVGWPKTPFQIVMPESFSDVPAGLAPVIKYFEEPYFESEFE